MSAWQTVFEVVTQLYGYAFVFIAVLAGELFLFAVVFSGPPKTKRLPGWVGAIIFTVMLAFAGWFSYAVNTSPHESQGCYDRQGAHDC